MSWCVQFLVSNYSDDLALAVINLCLELVLSIPKGINSIGRKNVYIVASKLHRVGDVKIIGQVTDSYPSGLGRDKFIIVNIENSKEGELYYLIIHIQKHICNC